MPQLLLNPGPQPIALLPPPAPEQDLLGLLFPPSTQIKTDLEFDSKKSQGQEGLAPPAFLIDHSEQRHWKLVTLDQFTGKGWYPTPPVKGLPDVPPADPFYVTITVLSPVSDRLPVSGISVLSPASFPIAQLADGTALCVEPRVGAKYTFQVHDAVTSGRDPSLAPQVVDPDVEDQAAIGPLLRQTLAPVERVARAIASGASSNHEIAERLVAYLQANCRYDPDLVKSDEPVLDFILRRKQGTCQHFAGSMAVMLRLLGIPARVIGGFQPNLRVNSSGQQVAYTKDAHVWVEVHHFGIGWWTYEPTPAQPGDGDGDEGSSSLPSLDPDQDFVPVVRTTPAFRQFALVDDWAESFASQIRRVLREGERPRVHGAYETGHRLNSARLYGPAVGDLRVYKRRIRTRKEPVEFLLAEDESASVDDFVGAQRETWDRLRFMLPFALEKSGLDFAIFGFAANSLLYKPLGTRFDDRVKGRYINAFTRGGTGTAVVIDDMRKHHRKHNPSRKRIALLKTDGAPTNPADYSDLPSGAPREAAVRAAVRKQVELAHAENLHVLALILPVRGPRKRDVLGSEPYEKVLEGLDDMFDRSIVLSDHYPEAVQQVTGSLISLMRSV